MTFDIIVALDKEKGIGKDGVLPWNLPGDMKRFKETTCLTAAKNKMNAVIMGRKTWDSIPEKFRPLPDRMNVVISRNENLNLPKDVLLVDSLETALNMLSDSPRAEEVEKVFIIGGQQIFEQAIVHKECQNIFATEIDGKFQCDKNFPDFKNGFILKSKSKLFQENSVSYRFVHYQKT